MRRWIRSRLTAPPCLSLVAILVLASAGFVALSSPPAARSRGSLTQRRAESAKPVQCGDTITTDVTLHHNLVNCPNNGLIIGAGDITLDLNYHTIDGDAAPASGCDPETEFCDIGVLNDGHDGVTVVHGSVRQFDTGFIVGAARHNRLLDITASDNQFPGIVIFDSARSSLRSSSVFRNGLHTDQAGIVMFHSHHTRILNNSIRRNGDIGLFMPRSDHNQIRDNRLRHDPEAGIFVVNGARNRISHNLLTRDGIGVLVALRDARGNVIARNRIVHPTQARGGDGQGIEVPRGSHNVIARNSIRDASRNAIAVGGEGVHGVGNVVRGNHIRGAGKDGVNVADARHTLLRRNQASHSKDDGFDVEGRTTKLTKNRAMRNGDLGIEAGRGVIDGGGNTARHNGDPRQCTHIACR